MKNLNIKMHNETLVLDKTLSISNDKPFGEGHLEVNIIYKHGSFGLQLTDGFYCLGLRFAKNYTEVKKQVKELLSSELS